MTDALEDHEGTVSIGGRLDSNDMKNFRPVPSLPFISKILEKVVLTQLRNHLSSNNLLEICQSAYCYRKDHSTETAVLSVLDGLLVSVDPGGCA